MGEGLSLSPRRLLEPRWLDSLWVVAHYHTPLATQVTTAVCWEEVGFLKAVCGWHLLAFSFYPVRLGCFSVLS